MVARFVKVPKASMHQDNFLPAWKHNVWTSRQNLAVNPKSVAEGK
jgi:hypothetical protein